MATEGKPGINERQMLRIQEGQELTGTNRRMRTDAEAHRERETPGRCEMHHTTLPISSAHCRSARPIESINLQAPHSTPNTMSQIIAAIDMSATTRGATVTDGSVVMPMQTTTATAQRPVTVEEDTRMAAVTPVPPDVIDITVPLIYDGAEDRCSICAELFKN